MDRESKEYQQLFAVESLVYKVTENLLVEMEKKGITVEELADRLEMGESRLRGVFDGRIGMSLRMLAYICLEIDLKPGFVFSEREP